MIEKWLQKQSFGIDGLEAQLRDVRSGLAPRQDSKH